MRTSSSLELVESVYYGSCGATTRRFLGELSSRLYGAAAAELFRAQKASSRAKDYGFSRYRRYAYDRKDDALVGLVGALLAPDAPPWPMGWGDDPAQRIAPNVLYIDTPAGQVSFHSAYRWGGPDYDGEWDGVRGASEQRVIAVCAMVYDGALPKPRRRAKGKITALARTTGR